MLCIYCNEREADAREHYLPQCLGRFKNFDPLLDRLCGRCNQEIGGTLERVFCRRSPEAVVRSLNWIKGQNRGSRKSRKPARIFQPENIGGRHLDFFAADQQTGQSISWQTDNQPGTIKEISQLVILDATGEILQHIPIPTEITTGRELIELLKKHELPSTVPKTLVIAASGDEERVQRLFSEINQNVILQRRVGGRVPGPQIFVGEFTPEYFRALAKIGFHYALKHIPTITGSETVFRPLREFIRDGTGDPAQFLSSCNHVSDPARPAGHLLTAVATPDSMIVTMQFFSGCKTALPRWCLILGPNPAAPYVRQTSAHFFTYTREEDGRLTGGEIVVLPLASQ